MKIVLKEDVKNLGKRGEIKEASAGYARNFLLPRDLAEFATPQAIKMSENLKKKRIEDETKKIKALEKMADSIKGIKVEIKEKAKEDGKLFGSVKAERIAEELNKKSKAGFDKDMIMLDEPIKNIGEYVIKIKISKNNQIEINLIIKEEK